MEIKIIIAIIGLVGSIISLFVGIYVGKKKEVYNYNKSINIEAWKERSKVYKELMRIMGAFPKFPNRIGEVKYQEILDCSIKLKDWYFEGGGLFLSEACRKKYTNIQEKITIHILQNNFNQNNPKLKLDVEKDDYESIRKMMSFLRTELTQDLLSRERNHLLKNV